MARQVLQYKLVEVHCVGREAMVNAMLAHDLQMRRLRTEVRLKYQTIPSFPIHY